MRKLQIPVLIMAVLLAGCEAKQEVAIEKTDGVRSVDVVPVQNGQPSGVMMLSGDYVVDFSTSPNSIKAQNDMTFTATDYGIMLSGVASHAAMSTGRTDGAFVFIGKDVEARLSGQTVKVSILARSQNAGKLRVAYSTNDVGNSGWKEFELSEESRVYSFDYEVPQAAVYGGDYLGLITAGNNVEVRSLAVTTL